MKVKKVNRYFCDFCKKSGGSSGHMKKHESGCTNNPNRVCGVCAATGGEQKPMSELIAIFSEEVRLHEESVKDLSAEDAADSKVKIPELRHATENCPACILAAIRLSKHQVLVSFDFKKEIDEYWSDLNDYRNQMESDRNAEIAAGLAMHNRHYH